MSAIRLVVIMVLTVVLVLVASEGGALAAKHIQTFSNNSSSESSGGHQDMMMDLSFHYVRDTQPEGGTDTAARFSVGGMFNEWIGLDLQGLYEVRARNYLVGTDFRLVPNDWFFLKAGLGGYAEKTTNTLTLTPIAGAGIMAHLNRDVYLVTEASYFTINARNDISFGIGLGTRF